MDSVAMSDVTIEERKGDEEGKESCEKGAEPGYEYISNPTRVMRGQLRWLSASEGSKYRPVKEVSLLLPCLLACLPPVLCQSRL